MRVSACGTRLSSLTVAFFPSRVSISSVGVAVQAPSSSFRSRVLVSGSALSPRQQPSLWSRSASISFLRLTANSSALFAATAPSPTADKVIDQVISILEDKDELGHRNIP
nr:uncharacterized protein LOC112720082 [Arachis hypogaea]